MNTAPDISGKFLLSETPFGDLYGQFIDDKLFLHFQYELESFSKSTYLRMLEHWHSLVIQLKISGCTSVYSCIRKDDEQTQKFQEMFGLVAFQETEDWIMFGAAL